MKMKWEDHGMKAPLARAKGLGSGKGAVEHWTMQRITSVANIPLVAWFVYSVVSLAGSDYQEFTSFLAQPVNAVLMILFIISTFYHAVLGAQVVVEDYVHHEGFKLFKLIGQKLFFMALGIACIFSILKIAL